MANHATPHHSTPLYSASFHCNPQLAKPNKQMIFFLPSILFSKYTLLPSMRGHSHHHHDHHHHFHRQLSSSSFIIDAHNWTNAVAHAHTTVTVLPTLSFALNIKYFLGLRGQTDGLADREIRSDRQTDSQADFKS